MKKQEIYFKSSKMLGLVNDLTLKSKEIKKIPKDFNSQYFYINLYILSNFINSQI